MLLFFSLYFWSNIVPEFDIQIINSCKNTFNCTRWLFLQLCPLPSAKLDHSHLRFVETALLSDSGVIPVSVHGSN